MDRRAQAVKPEVIAFRLFQGIERQHQYVGVATFEILLRPVGVGGNEGMFEFRIQQFLHQRRIAGVIRGNENGRYGLAGLFMAVSSFMKRPMPIPAHVLAK